MDVGIFYAGSRFSHHRRNGVPPRLVMRRLLVSGGRAGIAINLHQDESGRVIGLLNHIETGNARLADALAPVGGASFLERFDEFRFDMNMNMDN